MPRLAARLRRSFSGALIAAFTLPAVASATVLEPRLDALLGRLAPGEEVSVIAVFAEQADLAPYRTAAREGRFATPDARRDHRRSLVEALKGASAAAAGPLERFLRGRGVQKVVPLWVVNAIAVTAGRDDIAALASWPGVAQVRLGATASLPPPPPSAADAPAEWNLLAIRAQRLWDLGYTGQNTVVASLDTGVDLQHAQLGPRWRGGANSWFDPYGQHPDLPYDQDGHGTAVMGVLVGGNAGDGAIGVAPGASWVAAKIFNDAGVAEELGIHEAFQWLLDPDDNPATDDAPDVVNNSWGLAGPAGSCATEFEPDVGALRAAGIAVVFAAGNFGASPVGGLSPANNPGAFAAGAVDQSLAVAPFSSRGPSACDGALFPEVAAPGVGIRTAGLTLSGTFPAAVTSVSGTSFSAPHVAGALALLLSAFPAQPVAALEAALGQTAVDLPPAGADNASGSGLVDALGAFDFLSGSDAAPILAVLPSPSVFAFGAVAVGTSASSIFSVFNAGSADLLLGDLVVGGPDAAEFSVGSDACSGERVPPLASCTFDVGFLPRTGGSKRAVLAVASNDPVRPRVDVQLRGNDQAAIGTYRRGTWYLDNGNNRWDAGVDAVHRGFGLTGDVPVAGDWDGDGATEIGVFRRGSWYLDGGNGQWDTGVDVVHRSFGLPDDVPVSGDWDGDGVTEIGTFRGGVWYLDNGNGQWDSGVDTVHQSFGLTGDVPVTGDWNGDGATEIGVFRRGSWYLDNGNGRWDPGLDIVHQSFGIAGDLPVTGDWNGDGVTEIGVYRRGSWYLDDGDGRWDSWLDALHQSFGLADDRPVAGRWR